MSASRPIGHRKVRVLLSCNHVIVYFPIPRKADTLYCIRCEMYREFITAVEWKLRCNHCRFSHSYGEDERQANRSAITHVSRFPAHTIRIMYGDDPKGEVKAQDTPLPGSMSDRYHTVTIDHGRTA
jgi:hypothetical protein